MTVIYILLVIVLILLLIPLFISTKLHYQKSIEIDAPQGSVWQQVCTLTAMDAWSPWNERDPGMKKSLFGQDGTPGAKQSWVSSHKNVGEGSQTILHVDSPDQIKTKLEFLKPFKSTAEAYVKLEEQGTGTKVTWGFESRMPYPMNIMKLFMNFESNMDKDFGAGLGKLKHICETQN